MGKRGNREGTISRRKNGGWMAQYIVYTPDGRKRKTVYGKTRAEVSEKLTRAMADRDGGLVFDAGKMTVAEYLERWLADSARGTVRKSTYDSYEGQLRRYVHPTLGRLALKKLTELHVQGLYRSMQDRGLSARTVRYTHAVLRRALKQAVRWKYIPRNPCDDTDPPRVQRDEMRPLNQNQARRLLSVAGASGPNGEPDRFHALYVLAVHTGMRPGELLALKWEDVELEAEILSINRTLSMKGEFAAPKTAKSRRRIRLTAGSIAALKAHRKRQLEERMRLSSLWRDHGLVFPSTVGTPLNHRNLARAFKDLLKRASLPDTVRLYDLRHTCATLLLARNVHPKYVQELLGHASITLTLDTYSHVLPGMDGGATSAMEEALG
ncbi:site-specific integrase [soil metagenome]